MKRKEKIIRKIFVQADINIVDKNSQTEFEPHDIRVEPAFKKLFFSRVYANPSLGLAESYFLDHAWECNNLVGLIYRIMKADLLSKLSLSMKLRLCFKSIPQLFKTWVFNKAKEKPYAIGQQHYDKGNKLYEEMLGPKDMTYSCGLWNNTDDLKQAHFNNFDRACQNMNLKPGMKVLDVGCGNGSFLRYIAEKYKIEGIGITVSDEQAEFAREFCKGLPIKIIVCDYRELGEEFFGYFDAIASFGMFEHVVVKNNDVYFSFMARYLKPGGIFFLHSIASYKTVWVKDYFIDKWIFPNSYIQTEKQAKKKALKYFDLIKTYIVEPENYAKTLGVWHQRFKDSWESKLRHLYYDKIMQGDSFYKLWNYYLCSCQAIFKAHDKYVLQVVFKKK